MEKLKLNYFKKIQMLHKSMREYFRQISDMMKIR